MMRQARRRLTVTPGLPGDAFILRGPRRGMGRRPVALSPERLRGGLAEHAAAAWGHRPPQPLHLRKRGDGQVPGAISALR